jgi:membrane protease YdiL (CAAX protease family)
MESLNTRGQSMAPSNSLSQTMRRHPLFFYFLIAFGFTWGYELLVYGILHLPLLPLGVLLAIVGPATASFIMTGQTEGKSGVLRLLRRFVLWRVGIPWYLFVLLGIPALTFLGFFALPGAVAAFRAAASAFVPSYLGLFIGIFFVVSLPEGTCWRGFALPRLQQRSGTLVGTLILGVLRALWHLPLFLLVPGYNGAGSGFVGIMVAFAAFTAGTIALAVIFTWVFNNTRGSLLLMVLLHTSNDAAYGTMLPLLLPSLAATPLYHYLGNLGIPFVVMALLVLVATRGRLSYKRYQSQVVLPATEAVVEKEPETVDRSA